MSYPMGLDEYQEGSLRSELKRRRLAQRNGYCDYCGRERGTEKSCRMDLRHHGVNRFPEVICLCGSTRFAADFNRVATWLTLEGKIVVRPEVVTYDRGADPQFVAPAVKSKLDELHLRKIDVADRVLVVNVGGYIGESTRREINYALAHGVPVDYLEAVEQAS